MSLAKITKVPEPIPGADPIPPASWGHGGRSNLQAYDLECFSTSEREAHVSTYLIGLYLKGMRNIRGFRFPAFCTRSERKSVEKILRAAITASNKGGKYATGNEITSDMMAPSYEPWGGYFSTEWAQDRLHFTNTAQTVNICVNHEDHMSVRVTGTGVGFSAREIFEQYASTIKGVEKELNEYGYSFVRDNTYGYHTSFPQNMGTGLISTVEVLLPILMKKNPAPVFEKLGLNYPTAAKLASGVCEISPMLRVGVSEVEQVQILIDGTYVRTSYYYIKFVSHHLATQVWLISFPSLLL
jgi:ATP:guanido phosphotransferase, C-terminal catalytic domain